MKRMIAVVSITLLFLGRSLVFAQGSGIAYSWEAGNIAFAYPDAWSSPNETESADRIRVTILDTLHEGTALHIDRLAVPDMRVFDLMAAALTDAGVSIGAPTNSLLASIPALEVHARSPESAVVGIGRGTTLPDGSALLIWGAAPREHGNALLLAFDQVANSLVLGAWQMPLLPDGSRYTRIGAETLQLDTPALGSLTFDVDTQLWAYAGRGGETISLYALDINRSEALNLRMRLAAPEGTVIAENDNHNGAAFYGLFSIYDAGLYDVTLPMDGVYTIEVSSVFGEGVYSIAVRRVDTFTLLDGEASRVSGSISDVFANQTWRFQGSAGRIYTFTMFAQSGSTLDPALRLYDPSGRIVAQNDDARDPALGLNAQIVQVELPQDGLYRLEATRYAGEGEGDYEIIILETAR